MQGNIFLGSRDIFEGPLFCHRDYLNLGVVSEEFPEKDDSYQAGEEARKSLPVMGGRELEVFEEQAIATGAKCMSQWVAREDFLVGSGSHWRILQ